MPGVGICLRTRCIRLLRFPESRQHTRLFSVYDNRCSISHVKMRTFTLKVLTAALKKLWRCSSVLCECSYDFTCLILENVCSQIYALLVAVIMEGVGRCIAIGDERRNFQEKVLVSATLCFHFFGFEVVLGPRNWVSQRRRVGAAKGNFFVCNG